MAMGLPSASTIRSPPRSPARPAGESSWTSRTSRPSRSGRPTDRRSWRAARPGTRPTPRYRREVDSPRDRASTRGPQVGVGGQGQVEALAQAVGVDAEEAAVGVDHRSARRALGHGRGVLDAARHPPAPRSPERPSDRRDLAERDPQAPPAGVGQGEDDRAHRGVAVAPLDRAGRRRCRPPGRPGRRRRRRPATVAVTVRPSAKLSGTSWSWTLWALVSTRPSPMTTPDPRPHPWPMPTTDPPALVGHRLRRLPAAPR